jgi:hypothetical protein
LGGYDKDDDDDDDGDGPTVVVNQKSGDRDEGDPYVSYETVEDFVGSKSVGGFALREDEDDAYDDQPLTKVSGKVRVDKEAFDTVAYEHESDDEPADDKHEHDGVDFGGALSSWANLSSNPATATDTNPTPQGVTADGRPPLASFVLGGANLPNQNQRFRGPDLPDNYQVKRHVFGPDEHPLVLKAVSRAVQLEAADERRQEALQEALDANARSNAPTRVQTAGPMAGTTFVGLAEAMKNRFTASRASTEMQMGDQPLVPGLSRAKAGGSSGGTATPNTTADTATKTKPDIKITRTIVPFAPESLLCKRFGATRPKNVAVATMDGRNTEETYFQEEILKKAGVVSSATAFEKRKSNKDDVLASLASLNEMEVPQDSQAERPNMAIYKSIFEPESESSESEGEGALENVKEASVGVIAAEPTRFEEDTKEAPASRLAEESQIVTYKETEGSADQVDDETRRRRRGRRRSRSVDSSDASSDSRDRRKRRKKDSHKERRHRDEKKKKKKKSSKRKHEHK